MKIKLFFFSLFWLIISSCQKEVFNTKNPNVDEFISILKKGKYLNEVGYELPDFTFRHIDRLLYYLKDTAILSMFPTHPMSSKYTNPKILSECLMWTIDGIRLGNKYPSLEPCLINTATYSELKGYPRLSGKELLEISDRYINWYVEYKKNPSEVLKTKNLLENTSYKWN